MKTNYYLNNNSQDVRIIESVLNYTNLDGHGDVEIYLTVDITSDSTKIGRSILFDYNNYEYTLNVKFNDNNVITEMFLEQSEKDSEFLGDGETTVIIDKKDLYVEF